MNELPTQYGSVIGWARYFGTVHFFSAVLSYGGEQNEYAWWIVGETEPRTPDQMQEMVGGDWVPLGVIMVELDLLDEAKEVENPDYS